MKFELTKTYDKKEYDETAIAVIPALFLFKDGFIFCWIVWVFSVYWGKNENDK